MTVPQRTVVDLLDEILSEHSISFHPKMAHALGGIPEAVFVHHILYWTKRSNDGWAFRTQEEIEESTTLSIDAQHRVRADLRAIGILVEERRRGNRLFYRIDRDALWERLVSFVDEARKGPSHGPLPPDPQPPLTPPKETKAIPPLGPPTGADSTKPGKRAKPKTTIPSDFTVADRTRELVLAYPFITELDIDRELPKFINHHEAKGSTFSDWQAAFRKWMLNASTWRQEKAGPFGGPVTLNITERHEDRNAEINFAVRSGVMSSDRRRYLERRARSGDDDAARELGLK